MFAHLLDGSRAANRLGWQWTTGTGSGKAYGFSRWQVEKRAPAAVPALPAARRLPDPGLARGHAGPRPSTGRPDDGRSRPGRRSRGRRARPKVWLTAESLGDDDPALAADADRPAVFVFDEPLLRRLRLSGKRLVFLAETLGELAPTRAARGAPRQPWSTSSRGRSAGRDLDPGARAGPPGGRARPVEVHPWPWLVRPRTARCSYSAWRRDSGIRARARSAALPLDQRLASATRGGLSALERSARLGRALDGADGDHVPLVGGEVQALLRVEEGEGDLGRPTRRSRPGTGWWLAGLLVDLGGPAGDRRPPPAATPVDLGRGVDRRGELALLAGRPVAAGLLDQLAAPMPRP